MLSFLPRERQFWFYHAGSMMLIVTLTLISALLWGQSGGVLLASSLVWMAPYTLVVLAFRWLYERHAGATLPMPLLVPAVIAYSTLAGVAVMLCVAGMLAPFYWDALYLPMAQGPLHLSPFQFLWRYVLSNGFQAQLIIGAWLFVYVGASRSRAAAQAQLQNEQLQRTLKEAQLSSLSNQLNPHFLFNALNNIRFMIGEEPERAEHTLLALSDILRYSLESARHNTLPLRAEIEIVERYIAVVTSQLESRLRFTLKQTTSQHDWRVPPMLLQMLVENAVKHGIEPARLGGRVQVDIIEQGPQLVCCVCNDVDPAASAQQASGMGISLQNIERRLQLLYGARASLKLDRSPTQFSATICLPWGRL